MIKLTAQEVLASQEAQVSGENTETILWYALPELITAFVLHVMPRVIESGSIASLKSTSLYATLGVVTTLLHFIMKIAEGLSVSTLILCSQYNGVKNYKAVGEALRDAFWMTVLIGAAIALLLYGGAYWIFYFYGVPEKIINRGIPFLRVRAFGVFFNFIFFTLIGFLRGVKNTYIPMVLFIIGALNLLFFNYVLIFGKWGFPEMQLQGAAFAAVIQLFFMSILALGYILWHPDNKKYHINLFSFLNKQNIKKFLYLSGPIMVDKATMALVPIWLCKNISSLGTIVIAAFGVIKDLERLVLLPANALAHVVTFLVSNHYSAGNWNAIKQIITKAMLILTFTSISLLAILLMYTKECIMWFDYKNKFTDFSTAAFFIIGPLMLSDSVQLVLSGALRGATQVTMVMWTRLKIIFLFFMPTVWFVSHLPLHDSLLQFILVYTLFFISCSLMAGVYWHYLSGNSWQQKEI